MNQELSLVNSRVSPLKMNLALFDGTPHEGSINPIDEASGGVSHEDFQILSRICCDYTDFALSFDDFGSKIYESVTSALVSPYHQITFLCAVGSHSGPAISFHTNPRLEGVTNRVTYSNREPGEITAKIKQHFLWPDVLVVSGSALEGMTDHVIQQCFHIVRRGGMLVFGGLCHRGKERVAKILPGASAQHLSELVLLSKPLEHSPPLRMLKPLSVNYMNVDQKGKVDQETRSFDAASLVSVCGDEDYVRETVGAWSAKLYSSVSRLENAEVFYPSGVTLIDGEKLVEESTWNTKLQSGDAPSITCDRSTDWRPVGRTLPEAQFLSGATWMLSDKFASNYCHFFLDVAPKAFQLIDALNKGTIEFPDRILVSRHSIAGGFGRAFFELLPELAPVLFAPGEGIYLCQNLIFAAVCTIETELHRPSFVGFRWQALSRSFVAWIHDYIVPQAVTRSSAKVRSNKIYVSRRDTSKRVVLNEEEVIVSLERRGFQTIVPGKMSFYDQVAVSAQSKVMVGIHGAGLTNCLFSSSGSALVEIRSAGSNDVSFKYFAQSNGLGYSVIMGREVEDTAAVRSERSVVVDLTSLERHLDQIGV